MQTSRWVLFSVIVFCLARVASAQAPDSATEKAGMFPRMYEGVVPCLAWYDIPIATVDLAELAFISPNASGKPIKFPPTSFDTKFQTHVGVRGSQTFVGQVGEAGAAAFLGIRLLVNVGADLAGGNVTSEDYHRTFWFYKTIVYSYSITMLSKSLVERMRPDGSDNQSFFSGHSSTAFCTATYLSYELNDWFDRWEPTRSDKALRSTLKAGSNVMLFAGAAYVAYARMHDEKHYFSDVAVGAAVGTAVGALMYRWHWKNNPASLPELSFLVLDNAPAVSWTVHF